MRARLIAAALAAVALALPATLPAGASASTLTAQVNPLAGSLGAGFPMVGASLPFGMIEPGPDTALADGSQDPVNYDGYGYQDPTIRGFSLTHFDGAGVPIAGDLPFMPTTGAVSAGDPLGNASPYEHATEVAHPGYYAVTLARYRTRVELTATPRAALMRISYPAGAQANLLAEVGQSIDGAQPGAASAVGDHQLQGFTRSGVGYRLWFAASFDHRFRASGDALTFETSSSPVVTMRVAISYVDQQGAWNNLAAELPARRGFDAVRAAADRSWTRQLGNVRLGAGADRGRARVFYTNLYRAMLMPSLFDDADGRYLGFDGTVHSVLAGHHHYTNLSLWDSYRSQTPLLDLIEPAVAHDILVSLLDDYDQNRQTIPRWVQANLDRGIMGGDSGSATLADGVQQGLLDAADSQRALAALVHQADTLPPLWPREHLDAYLRKGYVGDDVSDIGAALTLEYAIDDSAVAAVARRLGDSADAARLAARAGSWRNLVDPGSRFIRPRNSDGSWANPTKSLGPVPLPAALPWSPDFQDGYQEGTGWQYLWSVPHDVTGLVGAIGGPATAVSRLDRFFSEPLDHPTVTAVPTAQQYGSFFGVYYIGDQYTPANEPDLWAPWYYDWLGQPWKTQRIVRAEMGTYNARPDGLPGNDDTGEMSAWYVLASLGIYHAAPGAPVYELNSPAFPSIALRTGARTLAISAPGASALAPYVSSAALNGRPVARTYLTTCELQAGGRLAFALSPAPDTAWASGPGAAPPSLSDGARTLPGGCTNGPAGP